MFSYWPLITETISAIGLTFNILTKWTGLVGAAVMASATQAVLTLKGGYVWLWNFGGIEYNVAWLILCLVVAVNAWREERKQYGRNFLFFPSSSNTPA